MTCCSHTNNALFFTSVDEIPSQTWENLGCTKNIYFHPYFLNSLKKNHPKIIFSYIILVDKNKEPIAFASIQIVDFYFKSVNNNFGFLKTLGKKLHIFPDKKPLKLLICGNTFVSGEHGVFIKNNNDKKLIIKELATAISHFVNTDKNLKIDAFLIKDFINESLFITDELKDYNYNPFSVEPNMVLKINKDWHIFDDYLAAMKTKFRAKAKKALKQSAAIKTENVTQKNIHLQLPEMTTLYKKVVANANFNLAHFNLETYKDLKEKLGENYILKTYWLHNKIVGFISGIINKNSLDAHYVGIDYELNKEYAIYQKMLYDYIEIAINKKIEILNFGRTASEIKSSVGAIPQDLTMYLRHKKNITNKILKLFLQRIGPTPFQQKFPFKKATTTYEKH